MIDWLEDYDKAFECHDIINKLKEMKFHGKVEINFFDGVPKTTNIYMCAKAGVGVNISVVSIEQV